MKRNREIVLSITEPDDKEVIWIYKVQRPEENELQLQGVPASSKGSIYQVKLWGNNGWENVLEGSLEYIRSQMEFKIDKVEQYCDTLDDNIDNITNKIGEVPEGTTIMGAINDITGGSSTSLDSLNTRVGNLEISMGSTIATLYNKVNKDGNKVLSTNDFTDVEKAKLAAITSGFMTYKGVTTTEPSQMSGTHQNGDLWLYEQTDAQTSETTYTGYIYNGATWDSIGDCADMTNFYQKSETYSKEQTYSKTEIDTAIAGATTNVNVRAVETSIDVPLVLFDQTIYNDDTPLEDVQTDGHFRAEITNYSQVQAALAEDLYTSILHIGGYAVGTTEGNVGVLNLKQASYNKFLVADVHDTNSRVYKLPDLRGYTFATGDCATLAVDFEATTSKKGLMSATDKEKLNNLDTTISNAVNTAIATHMQSVEGVVPIGGIIMWSGQESAIDTTKWALCNGQTVNGHITPDLRGRFIMSSTYGSTITISPVGPSEHNPSETVKASTNDCSKTSPIYVNSQAVYGYFQHKMTKNEINHNHLIPTESYKVRRITDSLEVIRDSNPVINVNQMTTESNNSVNFVPPYYVLAFIMRIA